MKFYTSVFAVIIMALMPVLPASAAQREYVEPVDTARVDMSAWASSPATPVVSWVPKDVHYRQHRYVDMTPCVDTLLQAWRGERLGLEALLQTRLPLTDVKVSASAKAPLQCEAAPMRYVTSTAWRACGYPSDTLPTFTVPDMIDLPGTAVDVSAESVRPFWCKVEVPADATPGDYELTLTVTASSRVIATLKATVKVCDRTLPSPADYVFYLDMWQQPYSVSRYYGVEPWSEEHINLLRPYIRMLARAGQKAVSAILFYEPWGEQSHDKFEPMVRTVRRADGSWSYDYTVFDRWVSLLAEEGITGDIECFSMVPWEMRFRYEDEATGEQRFLEAKADSDEYRELWTSFLQSFASHLRERGWYDRALIAMDERGLADMLLAYQVAQEAVPGIAMSLAGSYHPEMVDKLRCYTLVKGDFFPAKALRDRRAQGRQSLMYTCCATPAPSQFSNSDPADGAYIPVYATATGHDGYLHWSFMNWQDNPLEDSRFRMFAPGDTFMVYPDGRTSIRYERMVEGVQMSEKLRLLRSEFMRKADVEALALLEEALLPVRSGALNSWTPTSQIVNDLQRDIESLSVR